MVEVYRAVVFHSLKAILVLVCQETSRCGSSSFSSLVFSSQFPKGRYVNVMKSWGKKILGSRRVGLNIYNFLGYLLLYHDLLIY